MASKSAVTSDAGNAQAVPAIAAPANPTDLIAAIKRGTTGKDASFVRFAERLFDRVSAEDLATRASADWLAIAKGLYELLQTRKARAPVVRVFNPDPKKDGWSAPHTVIEIVNDDMPFLVDSVSLAMTRAGLTVSMLMHPVPLVARDGRGKITSVGEGRPESIIHLEIERLADPDALKDMQAKVLSVLADVRASVEDWSAMRTKMMQIADELPTRALPVDDHRRNEIRAFLRWAADDHFTFLGYREYRVVKQGKSEALVAVEGSGLGLLRGDLRDNRPRPVTGLAANQPGGAQHPLILTKTNSRATVHRDGYMDYIGVLMYDDHGKAVVEQRFLGLYTSSAYNRRPWDIPIVRDRHEQVMARSGFGPSSHNGKALRHIIETLPRDELFQSSAEQLFKTSMGILGLQDRGRSKLFLRRDRYGRFFSALAYIPRDRFNTYVRGRIEDLLTEALQGERVDTTIHVGESPLAQLHLIVRPKPGASVDVDVSELDTRMATIVRDWRDELRDELVAAHGDEEGGHLAARYLSVLPVGYVEAVTPTGVVADLLQIERLKGSHDLEQRLYRDASDPTSLRFKLMRAGEAIHLSEALPMMENMGLRVLSEHPYEIPLGDSRLGGDTVHIQDFEVRTVVDVDVAAVGRAFEDAFEHIWSGAAESDGFNRLLLTARLTWRQVAMLRGYCKYLLQTGVPFSQVYMETTLNRYPLIARLLVELFESRFDPAHSSGKDGKGSHDEAMREKLRAELDAITPATLKHAASTLTEEIAYARALDRDAQIDACNDGLAILLENVASLDEDRILRSYIGAINATLRTSYYQLHDGRPREYISYKFDCAKILELPKPRPYREIFVYAPRIEGVHLRFGPVARGGLRWSDRREDFRTEVLGLVKAQMVKNTVIVPVGSKGGFYVKRPPTTPDRDTQLAEGIACYKLFINGLLDITDNLVDGKTVPPKDVIRHDDDDPYLVVAADKGTATFSDIANSVSAEHHYWLGDAFASGGSVGYDHKAMGITAKGAWESVKRHFRSMNRDCQTEDFTCVGIGDMSGDVFGNGMLLSRHIRLLAAFDHRHIFLDPNPDVEASFVERERMFRLPRSSWEDYDKSLISAGGGIHPRGAKSIRITPQVREALDIAEGVEQMTPAELMSAILKSPVDLLWNGGIGTYVKATSETHVDVGDRANNALRVNGRELRCRMVGEGGNLGCTQRGRIEAALNGVLLNTDFIDNSAGVDTSDHEVNIKILLNDAVQRGELTDPKRNALLAKMTDEVGDLVLNDNYRQNQTLSLMERMSVSRLGSKQHFIRTLEKQGLLDRQIEFLPSDAELADRKALGQGLTRPELSILLSYAKIVIFQQLLNSDVPEDAFLSAELVRYFPGPLREKYEAHMQRHRLRREIIATVVTNSIVNRAGATFMLRMQEDTGRTPGEVAKAFTITRETLEARQLWAQIDVLDGKVPESVQIDALLVIWALQRTFTRWLLARPGAIPDIATAVERYHDGFRDIRAGQGVLPDSQRPAYVASLRDWKEKGLPDDLSGQLAALPYLAPCCDIIEIARERKLKTVDVARVYYRLGDALNLPWLTTQIDALKVDGRWHAVARGVLRDELAHHERVLVDQVLSMPGVNADARVKAWVERDDQSLRFTLSMLAELAAQKTLDYPTASVAVQRLSQLASRG
ncbi:MAG TPA: NAD-glutamate dehydrogenase [Xanthomonadaceae bacterium]|nr:NAD-glutamate dehydrogenase [Xanthomonadaceae bacterium]